MVSLKVRTFCCTFNSKFRPLLRIFKEQILNIAAKIIWQKFLMEKLGDYLICVYLELT